MQNKFNRILLVTVVVLAVAIVALLVWQNGGFGTPIFHAVYLRTGDMYFGKLVTFPRFGVEDAHVLQLGQGETPPSIQKLTDAVWGPKGFIEINRSQVVWIAELDPAKDLSKFLTNGPSALQQTLTQPTQETASPSTQE